VTHDQCDAKPTVISPAAGHDRPLTGNKLYCFMTVSRRFKYGSLPKDTPGQNSNPRCESQDQCPTSSATVSGVTRKQLTASSNYSRIIPRRMHLSTNSKLRMDCHYCAVQCISQYYVVAILSVRLSVTLEICVETVDKIGPIILRWRLLSAECALCHKVV